MSDDLQRQHDKLIEERLHAERKTGAGSSELAAPAGSGRMFPVLRSHQDKDPHPESVPWSLVEPHERQAQINHSQTLQRLSERGGLSPMELWHVVHDVDWGGSGEFCSRVSRQDAVRWLCEISDQNDAATPAKSG